MKWILAGMVYVAIAAAAFSQESWVYADLLWGVAFIATCYALLLAAVSKGRRRAMAGGFAVFTIGFALCAAFAPEATPTARILEASGVNQYGTPMPHPLSAAQSYPAPAAIPPPTPLYVQPASPTPYATPNQAAQPLIQSSVSGFAVYPTAVIMTPSLFPQKLRAVNATVAMLCGLLGCLLAVGAYRRSQRESAAV